VEGENRLTMVNSMGSTISPLANGRSTTSLSIEISGSTSFYESSPNRIIPSDTTDWAKRQNLNMRALGCQAAFETRLLHSRPG
jgi:hypothetical protein